MSCEERTRLCRRAEAAICLGRSSIAGNFCAPSRCSASRPAPPTLLAGLTEAKAATMPQGGTIRIAMRMLDITLAPYLLLGGGQQCRPPGAGIPRPSPARTT